MKPGAKWTGNLLIAASGLLLFCALGLWMQDTLTSTKDLLDQVGHQIEKDFQSLTLQTEREAPMVLQQWEETHQLPPDQGEVLQLVFDRDSLLVDWSNADQIPSVDTLLGLCFKGNNRAIIQDEKSWYLHRQEGPEHTLVSLIPLSVRYSIHNDFLTNYVFLGRFNGKPQIRENPRLFPIEIRKSGSGIEVHDHHEKYIFSILAKKPDLFRYPVRQWTLILGAFGIFFLSLLAYRVLSASIGKSWAGAMVLTVIIGARLAMILTGFPNSYFTTRLFSPALLALNQWNASLGDLTLNILIGFLILFFVGRRWFAQLSVYYRKWLQNPLQAWASNFIFLAVACGLMLVFFRLMEEILNNSTIYFEFVNIFKLDFYSLMLFVDIGGILAGLVILLLQLLRYTLYFIQHNKKQKWLRIGTSAIFVGLFSLIFWDESIEIALGIVLGPLLGGLLTGRIRSWKLFRTEFVDFLFLLLTFALFSTLVIVRGSQSRRNAAMELVANRISEERDLIMESLYDRAVKDLTDQSLLLQYGLYNDTIIDHFDEWLYQSFFQDAFKGYRMGIYVYDSTGNRLDSHPERLPEVKIGPEATVSSVGGVTITDHLTFLPDRGGRYEFMYLGIINNFNVRDLGKTQIQVEMFPSGFDQEKLYPQLLLDGQVRDKSTIPKGYEAALYSNGELVRKIGASPFPVKAKDLPEMQESTLLRLKREGRIHLFNKTDAARVVWVRTDPIGFYDGANIFSFIFYFYILAFVGAFFPWWFLQRIRTGQSPVSLTIRSKIQVFLLFISIIPLLVVIFFLSPYLKNRFTRDTSATLLMETSRLGNMLSEKFLTSRQNISETTIRNDLESHLRELEEEIFKDINYYGPDGKIRFTTQPAIYQMGLSSGLMNPSAFRALRDGQNSDLVIEDQLGKVTYFSGYYPMATRNHKIMGYLNIPFLSQQDDVDEQSQSLLAFLVNIYVLVFLSIGILGVVLSNAITRPLLLLQRKMAETRLGGQNEPIEWKSQDEIGEMIRSYNQMLEKLAENEKKLTATQRELAWRQMARQVAHEIKNPLTPMKLSIQHLTRSWKSQAPNLDTMFTKVTNTLLRQIDSLVNIANSFSEFAKMPEPNKVLFPLQEVIREVTDLYAATDGVQIEVHLPDEEFFVLSDRDQLSRVYNNLIKNAIQAMEKEEGNIIVTMNVVERMARVEIQDNGKGIPEEVQEKIFQPNFSTKSSGMGLGLAIVRRIIESAGGTIDFKSKVGAGTTFYIELPEADRSA
ncbi:MAG: HAMP domain-containing protein [Bacteroidia bacterium]|nr:HAMP domain-containing protein [Bacteroidia bacterium]